MGTHNFNLVDFNDHVDEVFTKVEMLEQRVNEIDQFYSTRSPDALKAISKKRKQDASHKEAAATKRMQGLIRQFATILRHITEDQNSWAFMHSAEEKALGLHDYQKVIKRPIDFSMIKNKMEAKDDTGYEHVRDIYTDVRLVFKNAMKYNDVGTEVHSMANTLSKKFEEKWKQELLPKVMDEQKRRNAEAEVSKNTQVEMQIAQEAAYTQMTEGIHTELYEVDKHLEELRGRIIQKSRRMSTDDKKKIVSVLTRLSAEDLTEAVKIVAQNNPSFVGAAEEVDLDLDAQSESTLWKLKIFVTDALQAQRKRSTQRGGNVSNSSKRRVSPLQGVDAL